MGIANAPWYGEDLGSAIEIAEKILTKIKTNKYDAEDLNELAEALIDVSVTLKSKVK